MSDFAIAVERQLDTQVIPPETCPMIDKVIKSLRGVQKIVAASQRDDDVEELHSALWDIDWELSGLEYELETVRDHNNTLRKIGKAWYALANDGLVAVERVEAERDTLRALLDEALKDTEYWINRAGKLDATLAALREPSEAVSDAAFESFYGVDMPKSLPWAIRAAVAAAEKEVAS